MKKYCVKCGKPFDAIGREVICPSCKAQAAEETKRAAVLRAKRASWTGESVPVRISGRASTLIREYSRAHDVPFAEALDALLQSTPFFANIGTQWSTIVPYKSHRRDKSDKSDKSTMEEQEVKQDAPQASKPQGKAQDAPQKVKQAAKASKSATASKATTSKTVKGSVKSSSK